MLSEEQIALAYRKAGGGVPGVRAVANAAAQAERHRIFAALESDPSALWRDQGFQEWRKNRQDSDRR